MEEKNKRVRAECSRILWAVLTVLLSASLCNADYIPVPSGETADISEVKEDYYYVLGELNLLPGGYATLGVYADAGSTINIYGCDLTLGQTGTPVQIAGSVTVNLYTTGSTQNVQFTVTSGSAEFDDPASPTKIIVGATNGFTGQLAWVYEGIAYHLNISTLSDINIVITGGEVPKEISIDIKPGSYPNTINLGSNGVIPVAILSSDTFDATTVDPETVFLAGAGVAVRGKGNKYLAGQEDVNGDGLTDLVVKLETENLDPGAFQNGTAILTGETSDGVEFTGSDSITIVPLE